MANGYEKPMDDYDKTYEKKMKNWTKKKETVIQRDCPMCGAVMRNKNGRLYCTNKECPLSTRPL